jgi:hypothetical protein
MKHNKRPPSSSSTNAYNPSHAGILHDNDFDMFNGSIDDYIQRKEIDLIYTGSYSEPIRSTSIFKPCSFYPDLEAKKKSHMKKNREKEKTYRPKINK